MSDPVVLAFSCDFIPYGSSPVFSFMTNTVGAGGVWGNGIHLAQFGGLSNGINFPLGFAASPSIVSGVHIKFGGGTNGSAIMWHGQELTVFGLAITCPALASVAFDGFGLPTTTGSRRDESGWFAHAGVWYYVELESDLSWVDVPGDPLRHRAYVNTRVWVDGRLAIDWAGAPIDTGLVRLKTDPTEYLHVCVGGAGSESIIDNFYAGGTQLGGVRAQLYVPTADGAYSDWSPSAGTDHFALIDEDPVSAADYIASGTPGDVDLFEFEDSNARTTDIIGGEIVASIGGGDAGREIQFRYREGSIDYDLGSVQELDGFAGGSVKWAFWNNPATGFPFTPAEYDAGQFGVEVVS